MDIHAAGHTSLLAWKHCGRAAPVWIKTAPDVIMTSLFPITLRCMLIADVRNARTCGDSAAPAHDRIWSGDAFWSMAVTSPWRAGPQSSVTTCLRAQEVGMHSG